MKHSSLIIVALVTAFSCLSAGSDRAARDLEVGRAEQGGVRVQVDQGLAVVRALDSSQLVLWGSAPSFQVELQLDQPRVLEIEVQNCLTDAELSLSGDSSAKLTALDDTGVPTRKRWQLQAPSGTSELTLAAPDDGGDTPFRFALLSDVQEAIDDVADVFDKINEQSDVRFMLGAGDLTSRGEPGQLERYQTELERLQVPYFTTLGNHELGTNPDAFHDYFGRGSFQFRFHGVYFTLLDSASATLDPSVFDWLDAWLANGRRSVHVVAMHIPPFEPFGVRNGSWASSSEASKLLALLAEARVDLTLYGHVHTYYAFENAGIPAYISGGGGANPERFDGIGRHFLLFDIDAAHGVLNESMIPVD